MFILYQQFPGCSCKIIWNQHRLYRICDGKQKQSVFKYKWNWQTEQAKNTQFNFNKGIKEI